MKIERKKLNRFIDDNHFEVNGQKKEDLPMKMQSGDMKKVK